MFNWLLSLFRPKELWAVYNREEYVGSFFQAAFYTEEAALAHIEEIKRKAVADYEEQKAMLERAGAWQGDFVRDPLKDLNLSVEKIPVR